MIRLLRVAAWLRKRWWRVARPIVVGVRVMVFDAQGRVLLVRHTYGRPAWYLPGGGVKRGETLAEAAARELREETGVHPTEGASTLRLHGVLTNLTEAKTDHIAVFVVDAGRWTMRASTAAEIAAVGFHDPASLPSATSPGTRRRIAEIVAGRAPAERW